MTRLIRVRSKISYILTIDFFEGGLMCNVACSNAEQCRYNKDNCEYKCSSARLSQQWLLLIVFLLNILFVL